MSSLSHNTLALGGVPDLHEHNDKMRSLRCSSLLQPPTTAPPARPPPPTRLKGVSQSRCIEFESFTVWLKIGSGRGDGTWSRISYTVGDSLQGHPVANAPSRGTCIATKVSSQRAFGKPTFALGDFTSMTIWDSISPDITSDNHWFGGDSWILSGT